MGRFWFGIPDVARTILFFTGFALVCGFAGWLIRGGCDEAANLEACRERTKIEKEIRRESDDDLLRGIAE
ncbi:hypothetical protein [Salipiger thiooxidans]|uniref:hypothetical protein n=1 Tax=Salipiger thiooxidans TaxID=282683 RepID=UPI001CF98AAC|nr:hypothetical protein [Salipiger thiooxidans]